MEPLDLAKFHRNSMLTVDATITGLTGLAANLSGLTGTDILWALSTRRGGPRLVTLDLDSTFLADGGEISVVSAVAGTIRIQFRPPLPPADPDPFRAKNSPYWQECFVALAEVETTQFYGPVQVMPSMLAADE